MRIPYFAVRLAALALVAACSRPAPSTTPAPQTGAAAQAAASGTYDLGGDWTVQINRPNGDMVNGSLSLVPAGDGWTGNLSLDGANRPYHVRSARVQGNHVVMTVETPDGDARIEGTMRSFTQFEGLMSGRNNDGRLFLSRR